MSYRISLKARFVILTFEFPTIELKLKVFFCVIGLKLNEGIG